MGKDFNQSVVFFEAIKLMLDMYPHFQKCPLDISLEASNPIGVSVDRLESGLFGIKLFATPDGNCFTKKLFNIFSDYGYAPEEAFLNTWLLVLHHEFGHIELSQKCIEKGLDPRDERNLAMEAGVQKCRFWNSSNAMESAIESFCDLQIILFAKSRFPLLFDTIASAIINIREQHSSLLVPKDDEYHTSNVLRQYLGKKTPYIPQIIHETFHQHPGNQHVFENSFNSARRILADILFDEGNDKTTLTKKSNFSREIESWRQIQNENNSATFGEKKPSAPGT